MNGGRLRLMGRQEVKRFVRGTLGCACPDEVFEHIAVNPLNPCPGLPVDGSLEVGGRLLIYITFKDDIQVLKESLKEIIRQGKEIRDRRGFNRFRYVVVANEVEALNAALVPLFNSMPFIDEKVHLHIITDDSIRTWITA
ncbi:MAG: hypothetical protein ABSA71_02295 [Desulfomonilia bacterium]|jgi:hypothetical protein